MMALNDALNGRIDHLLARARLAAIFRVPAIYPSLILSQGAIRWSTMADVQPRTREELAPATQSLQIRSVRYIR